MLTKTQLESYRRNGYLVVEGMLDLARTRVSQQPHIEIHRWKSDAPTCT